MRIRPSLQAILIVLTLVNLGILGVIVARHPDASSATQDGILRGRGLQIVDDQGRVRASITIHPPVRQSDGSTYPETVLLRMITSQGRPVVKLASSDDGAAMTLTAAEGLAYVQIQTRGGDPKAAIVDGAGNQITKLP